MNRFYSKLYQLSEKYFPVIVLLLIVLCGAGLAISQIATQPGQVFGVNFTAPTSLAAIGGSGVVTNPASNFVVQVAPGAVFCNGAEASIAPVQIGLLASKSFIVVYNCGNNQVYAKTAVVAPGTASPDQPGVPATLLFAIPGVEIPLATIVCNATACGNSGNGTITDARPIGLFPAGGVLGNHILYPKANNDAGGVVTLSGGAFVLTFANPYLAAPACVGTDQTAANAVKISTTTTAATFAGTTTDVIAYHCDGNPN